MKRARSVLLGLALSFAIAACGWNPSRPFDRDAPPVREAISDLGAGDAGSAVGKLEEYLSTGPCKDGSIGTPEALRRRADGTFDLGLALFGVGEHFGRRFGQEEADGGIPEGMRAQRHAQVECGHRVVELISGDDHAPVDLRARALYLEGNLSFLDGAYEEAVRSYDRALVLAPGIPDAGDPTGRDAAWNRAIALDRVENEKDAGRDGSPGDGGGTGDGGSNRPDGGHDGGGEGGSSGDDGGPQPHDDAGPPPSQPDAGPQPQPPPTSNEDEHMLDQLEQAPTLQQEEAKRLGKRRVRGMADK